MEMGVAEMLIAKAFPTPSEREKIVIATKIGYDILNHGSDERRGQRAIPHDFSPAALVRATDAALKRLNTDSIELLQLHNVGMEQVDDDAIWSTMDDLVESGMVKHTGFALGPAFGWIYEGLRCLQKRPQISSLQHIFNLLEQHPGAAMHEEARRLNTDTMFLVRVPHSSENARGALHG